MGDLYGQGKMGEVITEVLTQIRNGMRGALREAAQAEGFSQNEMEILLFLSHHQEDTAREISKKHGFSPSLVSKSVENLVKGGYVLAHQDQRDRRVVRLELTPRAEPLLFRLNSFQREMMERLCAGITQEEGEAFEAIVRKMSENVQRMQGEGFPRYESQRKEGNT